MTDKDKAKKIMYGLAIGDAFGWPTEFLKLPRIKSKYGNSGITELPDPAIFTDDTQMTIAIAKALIRCGEKDLETIMGAIKEEFITWLHSPDNDRGVTGQENEGVSHLRPDSDKDLSVPTERQMIRILNQIDLCIKHGKPVYVHCWGGRGRTGTVVGRYLARHGMASGKHVLVRIAELRKGTADADQPSPETKDQIRMVINWKAGG